MAVIFKYITVIVIFSVFVNIPVSIAQPPGTSWTYLYSGVTHWGARGESIIQTDDGGYLCSGLLYIPYDYEILVIKLNEFGERVWGNCYDPALGEYTKDIHQNSDGSYVIVGGMTTIGYYQYFLMKITSSGSQEWIETYGLAEDNERLSESFRTSDQGFILCGSTDCYSTTGNWDIYIVKTDSGGNFLWERTYGEPGLSEYGESIIQLNDGSYVFSGNVMNSLTSTRLPFLKKIDSDGNLLWSQEYDSIEDAYRARVLPMPDGGFFLSSWIGEYDDPRVCTFKTDSQGVLQWTHIVEDTAGIIPRNMSPAEDGYIIVGNTYPTYSSSSSDLILLKFDQDGSEQWHQTYGFFDIRDEGSDVCQCADGGFAATGFAQFDPQCFPGSLYFIKTEPENTSIESPNSQFLILNYQLGEAYPNPFNSTVRLSYAVPVAGQVELTFYDITGRNVATVFDGWKTPGNYDISYNPQSLASGIYFLRMSAENFTKTQKVVYLK